jgi:hypothetical protein
VTERHIDLNHLRAARQTEQQIPPTVDWLDETWKLPVELPFAVVEAYVADDALSLRNAAVALLGDQYPHALACGASDRDFADLIFGAAPLYGGADPEVSGVSDGSSGTTSTRSTPTSDVSTGSTSQPRAGESSL